MMSRRALTRCAHQTATTRHITIALACAHSSSTLLPSIRPAPAAAHPASHGCHAVPAASSRRAMSSVTQVGAPLRKKVTSIDLINMKRKKQKISMVTAYTYPSAVHVDAAGIDCVLVGDSVGMVELGYDTTLPVTMDDMLHHCKAVSRGTSRALLVADMPFGSYETGPQQAYTSAIRFLKEADMDCVKLEGGAAYAPTVKALVQGGVAVMGHIGLTPQRISVLGGFRAQGKTLLAAQALLQDALALQEAGAFAIVIECVPAEVAQLLSRALQIPTIGIGAGSGCDGQVLVYHDLLGMFEHAHHAKVSPRFCKTYGKIGEAIQTALNQFKSEVEAEEFPKDQYAPYKLDASERDKFASWAKKQLDEIEQTEAAEGKAKDKLTPPGQDETIKVY